MVYKSKLPSFEEPKTGIIQFIFSNKNETPENKPLLIDALDNRSITYAQLKDLVLRFGAGLQDVCDFKTDDVLALYAPNQVIIIKKPSPHQKEKERGKKDSNVCFFSTITLSLFSVLLLLVKYIL